MEWCKEKHIDVRRVWKGSAINLRDRIDEKLTNE
jgi:hypothetical protein